MSALAVSESPVAVIEFQPRYQEFCLTDEGQEALYHFGEVRCPQCQRPTEVSAQLGETESGYCFGCGTLISIRPDPRHLRMDDSQLRESGHGCVCGNPLCQVWREA